MRPLSSALVPAVVACAGLALAGCSASQSLTGLGPTATPVATLGVSLPPERAMAALPPEAGAVVSVVERRSGEDTVTQTITLTGDPGAHGDDRIEVARHDRSSIAARPRVDAETIEAEMADALPGVAMTISPRVITSPGGPVGVATGAAGNGINCLYAWSNAEARGRSTPSASFLGLQIASTTSAEMTVRVRLCRRGVSEERLIALAEGLRLRSDVAVGSGLSAAAGPVGGDALATAGYGAGDVGPGAVAYGTTAPWVAPAPSVAPAAAAPHRVAAAKPAPRRAPEVARAAPRKPAPETPAATVSAPIPLPAGG